MKIVFLIVLMIPCSAMAQQLQSSSSERALISKLMSEINTGLACSKQLIDAQTENEALKKQIEAAKPEPEKK